MGISGKVVEEGSNIPLANVQLVLMSQTKGKVAVAKSNDKGMFVLKRIQGGIYDIITQSQVEFIVTSKTVVPVTVREGKNVVGLSSHFIRC